MQGSVPTLAPAAYRPIPYHIISRAIQRDRRRYASRFKSRNRNQRFECTPWGIAALDCTIQQRLVWIRANLLPPLPRFQTFKIKSRSTCQSQHITVARIQYHDRSRLIAKHILRERLYIHVERKMNILSRHRLALSRFIVLEPGSIHTNQAAARLSPQVIIHHLLDTILPLHFRQVVMVGLLGVRSSRISATHIANNVRGPACIRIDPDRFNIDVDTRQRLNIFGQSCTSRLIQIAPCKKGQWQSPTNMLRDIVAKHLPGFTEDGSKFANNRIHLVDGARPTPSLAQLLSVDCNTIAGTVVRQANPIPVKNTSTNPRQPHPPHTLPIETAAIFGSPQHLDTPQVDAKKGQCTQHHQQNQPHPEALFISTFTP